MADAVRATQVWGTVVSAGGTGENGVRATQVHGTILGVGSTLNRLRATQIWGTVIGSMEAVPALSGEGDQGVLS